MILKILNVFTLNKLPLIYHNHNKNKQKFTLVDSDNLGV